MSSLTAAHIVSPAQFLFYPTAPWQLSEWQTIIWWGYNRNMQIPKVHFAGGTLYPTFGLKHAPKSAFPCEQRGMTECHSVIHLTEGKAADGQLTLEDGEQRQLRAEVNYLWLALLKWEEGSPWPFNIASVPTVLQRGGSINW